MKFPCKQCLLQCYLRDDTGHPLQPACVSFEAASVSYHSPDTCHTRSVPSQGEKDNYEKPASFPGVAGASLEVQKYAGIVVGIPNSKVRNPKPQNSMSPASPFFTDPTVYCQYISRSTGQEMFTFSKKFCWFFPPLPPLHQRNGTLCTPLKSCYQQDIRGGRT